MRINGTKKHLIPKNNLEIFIQKVIQPNGDKGKEYCEKVRKHMQNLSKNLTDFCINFGKSYLLHKSSK